MRQKNYICAGCKQKFKEPPFTYKQVSMMTNLFGKEEDFGTQRVCYCSKDCHITREYLDHISMGMTNPEEHLIQEHGIVEADMQEFLKKEYNETLLFENILPILDKLPSDFKCYILTKGEDIIIPDSIPTTCLPVYGDCECAWSWKKVYVSLENSTCNTTQLTRNNLIDLYQDLRERENIKSISYYTSKTDKQVPLLSGFSLKSIDTINLERVLALYDKRTVDQNKYPYFVSIMKCKCGKCFFVVDKRADISKYPKTIQELIRLEVGASALQHHFDCPLNDKGISS